MKNTRCYGRKQVIIPKEKSFIKNFFDGNKSSEISFLNNSLENKVTNNINANEENIAGNVSNSPRLFDENVFGEKDLEKSTCFGTRNNIKTKQVRKRRKCAERKKCFQRKPKGIQHFGSQFCKSHQIRWSEINSHKFTVENHRGYIKTAFAGKIRNMLNHSRISHSKCSEKNLSGIDLCKNSRKKDISRKPSVSSENDLSSKDIRPKKSKMGLASQENLDSSSDLFFSPMKVRKSINMKGNIKKKNNDFIHNKGNDENTLNELGKINRFMKLVKRPSVWENSLVLENFPHKKCHRKLALHSPDLFSETENALSPNMNSLLVPIADKSILNDKQVCSLYLSKFSVHDNTDRENGFDSNLDASEKSDSVLQSFDHKKCTPVNINDLQNNSISKQNRNLNKDSKRDIQLQINNSFCISENTCSKENLNASDVSEAVFNISNKESDIKSPIIHTKNLSLYCLGSSYLNKSLKLKADYFFPDKECIQGSDGRKLNDVTGKTFQNAMLNNNALSMLECSKIKYSDGISNTSADLDGKFNATISPYVSFIDKFWKSNDNKTSAKFFTSTPVKFLSSCDAKFSLFIPKISKSREYGKNAKLHEKPSDNVSLNVSTSTEIQKTLWFSGCPIMVHSKKSSTLPKVNAADSLLLKRHSSWLNPTLLPDQEDYEFSRAELLKLCGQDSVASFADVYNWKEHEITKIGEGTYGEVFKLMNGKESVLKIVPISEDPHIKQLQGLASVYSEVKITKCLSELRNNQKNQCQNFPKVIRVSVVSGAYPAELIVAWDSFNQSTYNDRPDAYSSDQLFVILEMEFGGTDLSHFTLNNAVEAESILKQIAVSLAIAEEEFSFEHRDLHLGNILIARNKFLKTCIYKLRGQDISFPSQGVHVIIIDFTLSLLHENGFVYYKNLAEDESLFEQSGDCQFDVYKAMRNHLQNKWQDCSLYSNILWLKYLCQKMKEYKYKNPKSKLHKKGLIAIDYFNNQLFNCNCALQCLANCGITENTFKRTASGIRKNSRYISRNSIQKSKLSICN